MKPDSPTLVPELAMLYERHQREVEAELRAEFPTGNLEIIRDFINAETRRRALIELRAAEGKGP